ncbi:MAG: type II toxin-antitoxin system VapC family toxin [Mycobacteriales bacterium]
MRYLLDTNVVSEWTKPSPSSSVLRWFKQVDETTVFLSVITIAEIRQGIERLPHTRKRERLEVWLEDDLLTRFAGRVVDIDQRTAAAWGKTTAHAARNGTPIGAMDAFVAASATVHRLTIATRNSKDFAQTGLPLVDPWKDQA